MVERKIPETNLDEFKRVRGFFAFSGIYLYPNPPIWMAPLCLFIIILIVLLSLINTVCTVMAAITFDSDFSDRLIGLESVFMSSLGVVKVLLFYWHRAEVAELLNHVGYYVSQTFTSKIVRATMISFGLSMFGVPGFWTINALAFGHFKTPMPYWFPFEINTSYWRFVPAFILGVVALLSTVYTNTVVDNSVLLIVAQLCDRVLVLRKSLQKLGHRHEEIQKKVVVPDVIEGKMQESFNESDDDLDLIDGLSLIERDSDEQLLKDCIIEHIEILRLIKIMDKILHIIYFFQIFLSMFLSCISIFAVTQLEDAATNAPKFIPIFTGQYIQFFIYCWIGEKLTTELEKLHFTCYYNSWYLCSPKIRKSLAIVHEFTKKAFVFRGLYLFNMSHQMYLRVIQDSVSYFMFLRTFTM